MECRACDEVDRWSDWSRDVDRLEADIGGDLPPIPPEEDGGDPPRRTPPRRPPPPAPELPWRWLLAGLATMAAPFVLQVLALTLGASQGTAAAMTLSFALTVVFTVPLLIGRAWFERQRRLA
jgi:hypothetical protein